MDDGATALSSAAAAAGSVSPVGALAATGCALAATAGAVAKAAAAGIGVVGAIVIPAAAAALVGEGVPTAGACPHVLGHARCARRSAARVLSCPALLLLIGGDRSGDPSAIGDSLMLLQLLWLGDASIIESADIDTGGDGTSSTPSRHSGSIAVVERAAALTQVAAAAAAAAAIAAAAVAAAAMVRRLRSARRCQQRLRVSV